MLNDPAEDQSVKSSPTDAKNQKEERDTSVRKTRFHLFGQEFSSRGTYTPGWFYNVLSRTLDIVASLIAIIIFSPIMLIVCIAIKLDSKGPILFRQLRSGLYNEPFMIYKFRSMRPKADAEKKQLMSMNEMDGPVFKMTKDPRITKVGKFIRDWSLDELPQLFNILKGDMAVVGPRPLPVEEVAQLDEHQMKRQSVRPGLTCIWQISGRSDIPFEEWIQLDLIYIKNRSILMDIEIILRTFGAVLGKRGSR
jgi:lipopolysaccharide/colanic/teichoic acid biosynthesis glycosyltransferase